MNFFQFKPVFSICIFLLFIAFTIIGTLSHEYGHILVAKYLGYETQLDYGSMIYYPKGYTQDKMVLRRMELTTPYEAIPFDEWPVQLQQEVKSLNKQLDEKFKWHKGILVTLGGPFQTMTTSFLGLIILWYRKSRKKTLFLGLDWLGVFLGLFILREVFNTATGLLRVLFYGPQDFSGDEFAISRSLGLNQWVVPGAAMVFGLLIAWYIIFKVIPYNYRFSFILAGFFGGLTGFGIWFGFLGRMLFTPI